MNFRNRWPHRQRAQTHPQPPPAACAPARRAGHPAGFSSHPPRGTTPPSTTPGRAAPHPTQSFHVVLGVGLPADVDHCSEAAGCVRGASCSPRANDARGRTATTPIRPPARCSWTELICDKAHVREISVDRRGVGRSPRRDSSGCTARLQPRRRSKRGARRWQTTPARDPPHWGVCVAFVLSQRASRRRSCEIPSRLGRDPAALEQLRRARCRQFLQRARGEPKRGGPLPLWRAWTPSSHRGDAEPALAATAIARCST